MDLAVQGYSLCGVVWCGYSHVEDQKNGLYKQVHLFSSKQWVQTE